MSRFQKGNTYGRLSATHGLTKHPLYKTYYNIKSRCYNVNFPRYKDYGALGVELYKEWLEDFNSFYNYCIDNGWYSGCDISRNGDKGNYEPGNIQFKTPEENTREMNLRNAIGIKCINNGKEFLTSYDVAKWIKSKDITDANFQSIARYIRKSNIKKIYNAYGYSWEVMPNEPN